MSNVSNAALRRELRKEKILKNAELRKQKIFGIGLGDSSSDLHTSVQYSAFASEDDISIAPAQPHNLFNEMRSRISDDVYDNLNISNDVKESNNSSEIEKLNSYLRSIPDPLIEITNKANVDDELMTSFGLNYSSENFDNSYLEDNTSLLTNSKNISEGLSTTSSLNTSVNSVPGNSKLYNLGDKKIYLEPPQTQYLFDRPIAPCLLALLVSLLLTYNFGSLVSHNLLIPFLIWELQQFISLYGSNGNNESKTNFLISAFLLCGIKKDVVEKYLWISIVCRDIIEDFSVYIFTIVIWHLLIGLPDEVSDS